MNEPCHLPSCTQLPMWRSEIQRGILAILIDEIRNVSDDITRSFQRRDQKVISIQNLNFSALQNLYLIRWLIMNAQEIVFDVRFVLDIATVSR